MPYLSAEYVCRFLRLSSVCREEFDRRLEPSEQTDRNEQASRFVWRHADLFLAGFPRVRPKPGYDLLCRFVLASSDRTSRLVGYRKDCPEMVPDRIDFEMSMDSWDGDDRVPYMGTARQDRQVLQVPQMPAEWGEEEGQCPDWLKPNPNVVLTDDGTPEGIFERAQLLLWSSQPVNRWHAVGYGHHAMQFSPPTVDDSFRRVDEKGRPLDVDDPARPVPLPEVWLPRVETGLSCANAAWTPPSAEERVALEGKTFSVVRFYTYSELCFRAYYEVTVWLTGDVWHSDFRTILNGGGGFIC